MTYKIAIIVAALLLGMFGCAVNKGAGQVARPRRVVLFVIDGLRPDAAERLDLKNIKRLAAGGASFRRACAIVPAHPKSGRWAKHYGCSLPNSVIQAGSVFIRPEEKFLQHAFGKAPTAHGASSSAYLALDDDVTYAYHNEDLRDEALIKWAKEILSKHAVEYMRLHLQRTGSRGWQSYIAMDECRDVPWACDVYADGSPYARAARKADELLGDFVAFLRDEKLHDSTLMVVMGDHGQAIEGGHMPDQPGGWFTPLIFAGPGVAKGKILPYAEHIDVAPTICALMGLEPPNANGGSGKVLGEIFSDGGEGWTEPRLMEINRTILTYKTLHDALEIHAGHDEQLARELEKWDRDFYEVDNFIDWHQAGTIDRLLRRNREIIVRMQKFLGGRGRATGWSLAFKKDGEQITRIVERDEKIKDELLHSGPAVENLWAGYRFHFDQGLGVDVYNKRIPRLELAKGKWYPDEKLLREGYGQDEFLVKGTFGLGSVRLWDGEAARTLSPAERRTAKIHPGDGWVSIETVSHGVTHDGEKLDLKVTLTVFDNHRCARIEAEVLQGGPVRFATGLHEWERTEFKKTPRAIMTWGRHPMYAGGTQPHEVGGAIIFDPDDLTDIRRYGSDHVLISRPKKSLRYWITTGFSQEREGPNTFEKFGEFVRRLSAEKLDEMSFLSDVTRWVTR